MSCYVKVSPKSDIISSDGVVYLTFNKFEAAYKQKLQEQENERELEEFKKLSKLLLQEWPYTL